MRTELPAWLPVAIWFGSVIALGFLWLVADISFRRAHQRRHGAYRSAGQKWDTFVRDPGGAARSESAEWRARLGSYFVANEDAEVDRLRRRSIALLAACVVLVFGGWLVGFVLVAALERALNGLALLILPQLVILGFWTALALSALGRKDRSRSAVALLVTALLISTGVLVASLSLTR